MSLYFIFSSDSLLSKEPIIISIQGYGIYGSFWSERCITTASLINTQPYDTDYSMLGMCWKNGFGVGAGLRFQKTLSSSFSLHSGLDFSLRNSILSRNTVSGTIDIVRSKHSFYQSEIPLYGVFTLARFSVGVGCKIKWIEAERNIKESVNGDRWVAYSRNLGIRRIITQPSIRSMYTQPKSKWYAGIEVDHRGKLVSRNTALWIDVLLVAGLSF